MSKIRRWQASHPGPTRELSEVVESRHLDEALSIHSDWVDYYVNSYDPDEDVAPDFYWEAKRLLEENDETVIKEKD